MISTLRSRGLVSIATIAIVVVSSSVLATPTFDFGFGSHGGPIRNATGTAPSSTLDPSSCRACHTAIYDEWAGSMHARSFVDPVFRAELSQTANTTACRTCHAPLADVATTSSPMHDVGVACATCHVRDGMILSTKAPSASTPHRTRVVSELSSVRFCGSCHDFRFPDLGGARPIPYDPDTLQQSTVTEWERSAHATAGRTCVTCHMPARTRDRGRPGTSHALRSIEDQAFVRDALEVTAELTTTATHLRLHLRLTTKGAGHAVPTGDIFRELRVRAWTENGSAERLMRRNFAEQHTARGWVLRDSYDDRVMPDESKDIVLELPLGASEARYAIEILRLDLGDARLRNLPENVVIVPVAEGTVRVSSAAR